MSTLSCMLISNKNSTGTILRGEYYNIVGQINDALDKDIMYSISMDQSGSCTGIFLTDADENIQCIFDFARNGTGDNVFIDQLFQLMVRLLRNLKIDMFIIEDVPQGKMKYSSKYLTELKGCIKGWKFAIPELYGIEVKSIFPQSWKSKVVNKSKGKNRHKSKVKIAEDVCDIVPNFKKYFFEGHSKAYDGFDAVGIYYGYKRKHFDEYGNKLVAGSVEHSNVPVVFFKYLTEEEIANPEIFYKGLVNKFYNKQPNILTYNKDYSFYENVRLCTSNNTEVIMFITEPEIVDILHWELDVEPQLDHYFVAFVLRKSIFSVLQFETACKFNYHMIAD